MKPVRVGIVGYGLSGSVFHAPFLTAEAGFEIAGIVTSRATDVLRVHPQAKVVANVADLLALPHLELVIIATPNHLHFPYAKQCLEAGKHVVVEKPFVTTIEEGRTLIELACIRGCILTVYQNRRWDGDFLTIRKLLQEGTLGEIVHFESHFDRYRPQVGQKWKDTAGPGNGCLFDLGSHLLDQALLLFGPPQKMLKDVGIQRRGGLSDDYFHLVLIYERLRVILHGGSIVAKLGPRFQIHGERGSFVKYGLDPQEDQLKAGLRPGQSGWATDPSELYGVLTLADGETLKESILPTEHGQYEAFYRLLHRAIRLGEPPPVLPEEALAVIERLSV